MPFEINTTELLVIADVHETEPVSDIYLVITNLADKQNEYFLELNFNRNRWTTGAEYFGPYRIQARETMLFAYQYQYTENFANNYTIRYVLTDKSGETKAAEGVIDLRVQK